MPDKGGKLIVVADDELSRDLKDRIAARYAFEVITARSGHEAMGFILGKCPDAVVADVVLTDMDGLQLLREVRKRGLETPFLLMTEPPSPTIFDSAMQLGAHDFIVKPYELDKISVAAKAAVEFGIMLKQVEAKIAAQCASSDLVGADLKKFRDGLKAQMLQQRMGWIV